MNHVATTEITAYNEFRAQLAELRELNEQVVFDYEDPQGNKEARSHIYKLRRTRQAVETCRKKEKQASLDHGRKVDAEAKAIMSEIQDMIDVHQKPINEIQERETKRKADILEKIDYIRHVADDLDRLSLGELRTILKNVDSIETTAEVFHEFMEVAAGAKAITLKEVGARIALLEKEQKLQAQRIKKQAEIEKRAAEKREREQKEREERIAKEAAKRAKAEERRKAAQETEKAKAREKALKLAAQKAKQEKEEAQQRALQIAKETEERVKRKAEEEERRKAEEIAKREADRKHIEQIHNDAVAEICKLTMLTRDAADALVKLIAIRAIPHIRIDY